MKDKLGVKKNRPLAEFLPAVTIAAKNLGTEMTNHNIAQNDLYGELPIIRKFNFPSPLPYAHRIEETIKYDT